MQFINARSQSQTPQQQIDRLIEAFGQADAIVIGAGAGLSTSAGLTYSGARFTQWFDDFERAYGIHDMYSGGFFPFSSLEEQWAYWSRFIYCNRYGCAVGAPYQTLYELVCDRDYFVLTTNVDHQFQRAGFEKERLFYTQGDYGLWQCSKPCHLKTYNNRSAVFAMLESQGYVQDNDGIFRLPAGTTPAMQIPTDLVPHCPVCGRPFAMNLRADNTFVEDRGWHQAAQRWADFQQHHQDMHALYLELGVGYNTPSIIKFPFWNDVSKNPQATYACINLGESLAPAVLEHQAILIDADIASTLSLLKEHLSFS